MRIGFGNVPAETTKPAKNNTSHPFHFSLTTQTHTAWSPQQGRSPGEEKEERETRAGSCRHGRTAGIEAGRGSPRDAPLAGDPQPCPGRLLADLLLQVEQELVVRQGGLGPVLDQVLHKAGFQRALVPGKKCMMGEEPVTSDLLRSDPVLQS